MPVEGDEELKRTNEIKMAIPLLNPIDIQGKNITADALLTQRKLADYLCLDRKAHYHFTVKGNQATLLRDIKLYFQDRKKPDFIAYDPPDHGRIETRKIWTTTALNLYLNFPHVQQAFLIERESVEKKADNTPTTSPTASPAESLTKQPPNSSSPSTAATGASKTAAITSWTGISMKTAVASAPATAQRTSPVSDVLPSVSSNPKVCAASHRKCENSHAMSAWSSITCA